jgi:hypothetical protein
MQNCEKRASSGEDVGIVRQTTAAHFVAMSHYASPGVFSHYITTRQLIRCREGYVRALRGRSGSVKDDCASFFLLPQSKIRATTLSLITTLFTIA